MPYALYFIMPYHEVHLLGVVGNAAQFVTQLHVFPGLIPGHQDRLV